MKGAMVSALPTQGCSSDNSFSVIKLPLGVVPSPCWDGVASIQICPSCNLSANRCKWGCSRGSGNARANCQLTSMVSFVPVMVRTLLGANSAATLQSIYKPTNYCHRKVKMPFVQ